MPASKVVIIYSLDQARVRRFIIPDTDDSIAMHSLHGKGEGVLLMDYPGRTPSVVEVNNHIASVTGRAPKDDRYVIVGEDGKVEFVVLMDPLTDDAEVIKLPPKSQAVPISDAKAVINALKDKVQ